MFYKVTLQRIITVPPRDLDRVLHRKLLQYLRDAVESKPMPLQDSVASMVAEYKAASKSSAVVIAVLDILRAEALQGKVLDDGNVSFMLTYDALVMKLHCGEVVDVVVDRVSRDGWYGDVYGLGKIFVSHSRMSVDPSSGDWAYEEDGAAGAWTSKDGSRSVKMNDIVRVRVFAETPQAHGAIALGEMEGAFLGPI